MQHFKGRSIDFYEMLLDLGIVTDLAWETDGQGQQWAIVRGGSNCVKLLQATRKMCTVYSNES